VAYVVECLLSKDKTWGQTPTLGKSKLRESRVVPVPTTVTLRRLHYGALAPAILAHSGLLGVLFADCIPGN
jgi:hypothetical protein